MKREKYSRKISKKRQRQHGGQNQAAGSRSPSWNLLGERALITGLAGLKNVSLQSVEVGRYTEPEAEEIGVKRRAEKSE